MKAIKNTILGLGIAITGWYGLRKLLNTEPAKYSLDWIKNLTDDQWKTERKLVQDMYHDPQHDIDIRENYRRILRLFDKVKSDMDWEGRIPQGPAYHREH